MEKARKQPGPGDYQSLANEFYEIRYNTSQKASIGKGKRHPVEGIGTNLSKY
jgi:hypothetical protein